MRRLTLRCCYNKNQYAEAADYWRQYLSSDCQTEWGHAGAPIVEIL
jgi:hypothetical protein